MALDRAVRDILCRHPEELDPELLERFGVPKDWIHESLVYISYISVVWLLFMFFNSLYHICIMWLIFVLFYTLYHIVL